MGFARGLGFLREVCFVFSVSDSLEVSLGKFGLEYCTKLIARVTDFSPETVRECLIGFN